MAYEEELLALKQSLEISDSKFDSKLLMELSLTLAKLLSWLYRDALPSELKPIWLEATEHYFVAKYPDYTSGSTLKNNEPDISSISDKGQSISYRNKTDSMSQKAIESGLDTVLGEYFSVLVRWRLTKIALQGRTEP